MAGQPTPLSVRHNEAANRFEIGFEGGVAVLDYRISGKSIVFYHTGVPPEHQGRGIAAALVREGLRHAREAGLKVVAQCSYVAAYVRRHPQEAL